MTGAPPPDPVLLAVGRLNLDLFGVETGVPMAEVRSFRASVGGSPTNIAIAARRLGVAAAVLTAAGTDPAGDLVVRQLAATGVDTRWVRRLTRGSTSMALLATVSPDDGERQFYRDDPSDVHLDPSHARDLPWSSLLLVVLSADALARGTTPGLVAAVSAEARQRGVPVWWDLDLRESNWTSLDHFGEVVRPALDGSTVVLGTEAEFAALLGLPPDDLPAVHRGVRDLDLALVILKTGPEGAVLLARGAAPVHVPASVVSPVCTVGGGDALAGGLVRARLAGESWLDALAYAMRVAGWTVGRPGCSEGFPSQEDLDASIALAGRRG